jgi:hypothetical protein
MVLNFLNANDFPRQFLRYLLEVKIRHRTAQHKAPSNLITIYGPQRGVIAMLKAPINPLRA